MFSIILTFSALRYTSWFAVFNRNLPEIFSDKWNRRMDPTYGIYGPPWIIPNIISFTFGWRNKVALTQIEESSAKEYFVRLSLPATYICIYTVISMWLAEPNSLHLSLFKYNWADGISDVFLAYILQMTLLLSHKTDEKNSLLKNSTLNEVGFIPTLNSTREHFHQMVIFK